MKSLGSSQRWTRPPWRRSVGRNLRALAVELAQIFVGGPGLVPGLRLGGGDDWALAHKGGTFFLGEGRDRLTLGKYDSVAVTFPLAELTVNLHRAALGDRTVSRVFGVETLLAAARQLEVLGSSRADRITASGYYVLVRGGPGADVIDRGQDVGSICDSVTTRFQGGVGNDCLIGSKRTNDVLLGALVFDHAIGVGGTDMVPGRGPQRLRAVTNSRSVGR